MAATLKDNATVVTVHASVLEWRLQERRPAATTELVQVLCIQCGATPCVGDGVSMYVCMHAYKHVHMYI
jgi:hypothetical protein